MAERASITQGIQVGVETTPGTGVAANRKLLSIGFEPGENVDMQVFRPYGQKYPSIITPGKEWVEFDITGVGSYTELLYLFSSCLVSPGAPVMSDTTAQTWTFAPSSSAEDTVKTLTIEQGGAVRAHKFSYGLVTEIELTFNRDGVEVGGSGMGQRISDNITLTPTPTSKPELPILPTDIDVYLDATSGAIGTTKLLRVLEATVHIGDRFNPVWVLNSTLGSFAAHVESEPTAEITLLMEADAEGMAALTQMRGGSSKFMRVKATSPTLAGAATAPYSLAWDAAVKVSDMGNFSDEDGVYAVEWTFDMVHDATWGKAYTVALVNKETVL